MQEHHQDEYVLKARAQGYRSRAVFKLEEIQRRDHVLKPGQLVLDLGAAPGGWSEYASRIIGDRGRIIALDLLPIEPIAGVEFLQGDFTEEVVFQDLLALIGERSVDLVISDMAPNLSGMKAVDQPRVMYLAELALDMACNVLEGNGSFVAKVFQGEGFDELIAACREVFAKVIIRKPKSSRARSAEVYIVARQFKP